MTLYAVLLNRLRAGLEPHGTSVVCVLVLVARTDTRVIGADGDLADISVCASSANSIMLGWNGAASVRNSQPAHLRLISPVAVES